jgi:hypothetical protein
MIASLALAGAGALMLWMRPPEITQEKVERIHEGMTRVDVVSLLGPAGDYSTGPLLVRGPSGLPNFDLQHWMYASAPDYGSEAVWVADIGVVVIRFDDDQRVISCWFYPLDRVEQNLLENLLWRAKRQWRKWFP